MSCQVPVFGMHEGTHALHEGQHSALCSASCIQHAPSMPSLIRYAPSMPSVIQSAPSKPSLIRYDPSMHSLIRYAPSMHSLIQQALSLPSPVPAQFACAWTRYAPNRSLLTCDADDADAQSLSNRCVQARLHSTAWRVRDSSSACVAQPAREGHQSRQRRLWEQRPTKRDG